MDDLQTYVQRSRYARYLPEKVRRESWHETVSRYCDYFSNKFPDFPKEEIYEAIYKMEVLPSMRALKTAGKALERDQISGYNCAFVGIDDPRIFDEILYILCCGTGVGFSVERQFIAKLPTVADSFFDTDTVIHVRDSKIGWATAFRELIALLYSGKIPKYDVSAVRPAGARLKTFGGRASGPGPLVDLFKFTINLFIKAAGRKLTSLECHDLICKIAEIVVVGGVRRSALLSLSNLTDLRMQGAKNGQWWEDNGQRALANNSVAYTEKPDIGIFMKEWGILYESKSGERGIFNRVAARNQAAKTGRRDPSQDFGINPCGEIILRASGGLCNLSEAVCRADDTKETIRRKVRITAIIGTFQATLTNFRYLRKVWQRNAEEERLLGVALSGIMDCGTLSNPDPAFLEELKQLVIDTNKEWAEKLGSNQSAAVTTIKPSGTTSQLTNTSSGIHPRYSPYYIRTVRGDKKDPLSEFLRTNGVPCEDDVTNNSAYVFSFPIKSPEGSIYRNDMSAIDQLNLYLVYKEHWCEHNPSITVYVRDHEWMEVGAWVYKNFDSLIGVSFLPHTDHIYRQAPYQEITEEEYNRLKEKMPVLDWEDLIEPEEGIVDNRELSCVAGSCELF